MYLFALTSSLLLFLKQQPDANWEIPEDFLHKFTKKQPTGKFWGLYELKYLRF